MTIEKVYENLCWYDKRNPDYFVLDGYDEPQREERCYCDNCFYRRTEMAEEIIRLTAIIEETKS